MKRSRYKNFLVFVLTTVVVGTSALAPNARAGGLDFSFRRAGAYDLKCKLTLELIPTPLGQLAQHLHMTSEALSEALGLFRQSSAWPNLEALFIYGSRAHKYWGFKYDLDVLVLPIEGPKDQKGEKTSAVDLYAGRSRLELDTRDFVSRNNFRIDLGNAKGKTLRTLIAKRQLMTEAQENLFLARVTPALNRTQVLAETAVQLAPNDVAGNAQLQKDLISEFRRGNPFFQNPNLSITDFPSILSEGYRRAAADLGLEGIFLTTQSPILIKKSPRAFTQAAKLRKIGYSHVYLMDETGALSF